MHSTLPTLDKDDVSSSRSVPQINDDDNVILLSTSTASAECSGIRIAGTSEPASTQWKVVFGAFVALFATFGQMNAFGTFQVWYMEHQLQHLSASTISWIGSIQLFVFFASGGPIGFLFDAQGPRLLMSAGTIASVRSLMLTSASSVFLEYLMFQGVLLGIGVALIFYPSVASISRQFTKYRGTAVGIAVAGSSIGGVVFPILLRHLFDQVGFSWTLRITGFICLACCGLAIATVTCDIPKNFPVSVNRKWIDFSMFNDVHFVLLASGAFPVALGLYVPFFYISHYACALGLSSTTAFAILAIMNAGGCVGRVAPACLSDWIGHFNILVPSSFLSGVACLLFWMFAKRLVPLAVFAAVYGFTSGAAISVLTPCVARILEGGDFGARIGMLYSVLAIPTLVGEPIAGALLGRDTGSYVGMIAFTGTTMVVGSLTILYAKLKVDSKFFART